MTHQDTTQVARAAASSAEMEAARMLLERMGISPEQLLGAPRERPSVPTFAEYIPIVAATVSPGTRRVYDSYWNRILDQWADRRLDEPTATDVEQLLAYTKTHTVARRNARGGRSAGEHLISALRCIYRRAENDGLIDPARNPARKVAKPRRLPSTRRAVANDRLAQINRIAATTGNDPALDSLLLRLHTETACRRGGALALRPMDLEPTHCLIQLREKGDTVRWQPVSSTLMAALLAHAEQRGAPREEQLLRYANGRPITKRRYDHVWARIGTHLPWVITQGISTHWLRHTTLTWVERNFSPAIATAYAGHTTNGRDQTTTATYTRATQDEIIAALVALTGEPHPLQPCDPMPERSAHPAPVEWI